MKLRLNIYGVDPIFGPKPNHAVKHKQPKTDPKNSQF
tara:strand:+ start:878 stop:988 length:111 start_codon:yes stop_codon:yes gene_type:complete